MSNLPKDISYPFLDKSLKVSKEYFCALIISGLDSSAKFFSVLSKVSFVWSVNSLLRISLSNTPLALAKLYRVADSSPSIPFLNSLNPLGINL